MQFTKLEANVNKVQTQIETKVGSLKDSLESTLEAKVGSLQVNIQKHLDTIQSTIAKVSKDLGSRLDQHDASMTAFHEMNAHNAQTMQHCLANVAASATDLKHAATIQDTPRPWSASRRVIGDFALGSLMGRSDRRPMIRPC